MATRPLIKMEHTVVASFVAKSAASIVEGVGVKFDSDGIVTVAGANDKVIGVALETLTGDGVKRVQVAMGGGIVKVKCSGTATAGEYAVAGTDGFQNQTMGGGTTVRYIAGIFMQDGVDDDMVGLLLAPYAAGSA